jgi:hypothetical protein
MIPLKYYFKKIPNDYETLKALSKDMDISLCRTFYKSGPFPHQILTRCKGESERPFPMLKIAGPGYLLSFLP